MVSVVPGIATQQNPGTRRMHKIAVAPFASAIGKPGLFQFGDKLSNLARHLMYQNSIRMQNAGQGG